MDKKQRLAVMRIISGQFALFVGMKTRIISGSGHETL
jgi:hypothetical protein